MKKFGSQAQIAKLRRVISARAFENARGRWLLPRPSNVALMFTDIESFTPVAHAMKEKVIPLLGLYFSSMADSIYEGGGDVDKFIGDAIFAYFFDPIDPKNSANMAFDTAMAMLAGEKTLAAVNSEWKALFAENPDWRKFQNIKTRIGLHWGDVIAGSFGSTKRADNTLLGDNVNLTSRMESLCKQYRSYVLLTDVFYEKLTRDRQDRCRMVDRVTVVGREHDPMYIHVVDLRPMPGAVRTAFETAFETALQEYLAGNWKSAFDSFSRAQEILRDAGLPEDGPTDVFIERIGTTNSFWKKALKYLRDNASGEFPQDVEANIRDRFYRKSYTAPADWPGYWQHDRK